MRIKNFFFFFFDNAEHKPCGKWQQGFTGKCVWSVLMHCHLPKSSALQQLSLAASHSEAFYSLWISVKSLSSHTALCSAPLFGTLGGHFSSNRGKERSSVQQALAVFVFMHVMGISLSGVVLNISNDPCRQA